MSIALTAIKITAAQPRAGCHSPGRVWWPAAHRRDIQALSIAWQASA